MSWRSVTRGIDGLDGLSIISPAALGFIAAGVGQNDTGSDTFLK